MVMGCFAPIRSRPVVRKSGRGLGATRAVMPPVRRRELRRAPVRPGSIDKPAPSTASCTGSVAGRLSRWPSTGDHWASRQCKLHRRTAPASAAGAAAGQCGAPAAAPLAQDSVGRVIPSIEPVRTGAQRTTRRARAARPHFLHRSSPVRWQARRTRLRRSTTPLGPRRVPQLSLSAPKVNRPALELLFAARPAPQPASGWETSISAARRDLLWCVGPEGPAVRLAVPAVHMFRTPTSSSPYAPTDTATQTTTRGSSRRQGPATWWSSAVHLPVTRTRSQARLC